ncbi:g8973 [Coccomyxa viridis]|uniref:G8973 protein n=1 Tax=Coccomyxa viridis TaxID=1274662 RepID=A0ABP1G5U9_9CHLO
MGTEMGEDGNKVLDLGNMKDLLELTDGNDLWYKGTLDFAVVPYIVSQEDIDAKSDIRVGFVHLENRDYKGRSKEGSDASRLKKHHSQAIVTMYAVLSKSSAPLDLIVTDGMTFDLFRFREDRGVLVYHDLSGTEAYFALSEALKENWMSE